MDYDDYIIIILIILILIVLILFKMICQYKYGCLFNKCNFQY